MKCDHIPDESFLPEEPDASTAYFVPCVKCKQHLMIRKAGSIRKPTCIKILPDGSILTLPLDEIKAAYARYKKNAHLLDLSPPRRDFNSVEMKNTIYDLLADGEITIDQFNTLISRVK